MLTDLLPYILAMVFCVIMSAYFSATETAFSSLNRTRLKALSEKGNKKYVSYQCQGLLRDPQRHRSILPGGGRSR